MKLFYATIAALTLVQACANPKSTTYVAPIPKDRKMSSAQGVLASGYKPNITFVVSKNSNDAPSRYNLVYNRGNELETFRSEFVGAPNLIPGTEMLDPNAKYIRLLLPKSEVLFEHLKFYTYSIEAIGPQIQDCKVEQGNPKVALPINEIIVSQGESQAVYLDLVTFQTDLQNLRAKGCTDGALKMQFLSFERSDEKGQAVTFSLRVPIKIDL